MNSTYKLSKFYLKKAKLELGEDEIARKQGIKQLRAWIKSQPNIRKCRDDDLLLLAFLRARKYSVSKSMHLLKNHLMCPKDFPQYFTNVDVADQTLSDLIESGTELVMPERDTEGSRIIIYRCSVIDRERFTIDHCIKLGVAIYQALLSEEETQIAGIVNIIDMTDIRIHMLTFFSMSDFKNLVYLLTNVLPCRHKAFYIMGFPSFGKHICELAMTLVHKKLRNRLFFINGIDELKSLVDVKLLPREYGGKISIQENITYLMDILQKRRDLILQTNDSDVDFRKNKSNGSGHHQHQEIDVGTIGSFRKLEID